MKLLDDDDNQQEKIVMQNYENFDFWIKTCWLLLVEYHQKPLQSTCMNVSFKESQIVLASLCSPNCPDYIKEIAILMYPEQFIQTDDQGNVPLHVMAMNYHNNIKADNSNMIMMMLWMINICPEAASIRNNQGQLPLICLNNSYCFSFKLSSSSLSQNEDATSSKNIFCWSHLIGCLIHANPAAMKDIRDRNHNSSNNEDNDLRIQQYHVQIWSNLLVDNNNSRSCNQMTLYEKKEEDKRKQSTNHTIYQNLIQNPSWFCGNEEDINNI